MIWRRLIRRAAKNANACVRVNREVRLRTINTFDPALHDLIVSLFTDDRIRSRDEAIELLRRAAIFVAGLAVPGERGWRCECERCGREMVN